MLLNHTEIEALGIIGHAVPKGYRAAGYDVRVGKIITADGVKISETETFLLKPQGVVEIISAETVTLPANICGYAMVKTSLCNDGLLALNIGIIDPFYEGFVSTTLLNFSKQDHELNVDEVFLRLTFHECYPAAPDKRPEKKLSPQDYTRDRRKKVGAFGSTFLHLDATLDASIRTSFVKYGFMFALTLSLMTLVINLGLGFASYYLWKKDPFLSDILRRITVDRQEIQAIAERTRNDQNQRFEDQRRELDELRRRLAAVEARVLSSAPLVKR